MSLHSPHYPRSSGFDDKVDKAMVCVCVCVHKLNAGTGIGRGGLVRL